MTEQVQTKQLDIFEGRKLRDKGIKQAVDNADLLHENWANTAYQFLINYLNQGYEFMTEDVRVASFGIIPEPPSKRAWGAIIVKAKKEGLIYRVGYSSVKNPKAHGTPAAVWKKSNDKL